MPTCCTRDPCRCTDCYSDSVQRTCFTHAKAVALAIGIHSRHRKSARAQGHPSINHEQHMLARMLFFELASSPLPFVSRVAFMASLARSSFPACGLLLCICHTSVKRGFLEVGLFVPQQLHAAQYQVYCPRACVSATLQHLKASDR